MILETLKIKSRSPKTNHLLKDLPMRYLCQFGPNLAICSEDSAEKFFYRELYDAVDLENKVMVTKI